MSIVRSSQSGSNKKIGTSAPNWWAAGVVVVMTIMLCVSINYRSFSEMSKESAENLQLEQEIQSVTTNNLLLQEQIHYLKNDPGTVEREVRKFGLRRPKQKVSVLTDK